jgi:hypothetical protein
LRPEKCGQPGAADVVDAAQVEHDHLHLRGQDALELGVETRRRLGIEPADQRDCPGERSAFLELDLQGHFALLRFASL